MSRFFSEKYSNLIPYTPGEQPREIESYIKLNTNESPFPPALKAQQYTEEAAEKMRLYPDPEYKALRESFAALNGLDMKNVLPGNGSDEILNLAFMAFCDQKNTAVFPDITYGFYEVFAEVNGIPFEKIPLKEDFSVDEADYCGINKTVFIANPNAPTGISMSRSKIERILESNPDNVIVIDEAYVDFGGESCVPLIEKYSNLLVTQTFSKSRSMAGARLGFAIGCEELINDLNTIRYSLNPYNVNGMTAAAGIGSIKSNNETLANCEETIRTRAYTACELKKLGFVMTESSTNFLFAAHPSFDGEFLYKELKKRKILVRHFNNPRIRDYNRITVGSRKQMETLIEVLTGIIAGN